MNDYILRPADIIRQLLLDKNVFLPAPADLSSGYDQESWYGFTGGLPEGDPDKSVAVVDTGAIEQPRLMRGQRVTFPSVSVTIRCPNYAEGYDKARDIENTFDAVGIPGGGVTNVTVGTEQYKLNAVTVTSPPMKTGYEEQNRRQVFTLLARLSAIKL